MEKTASLSACGFGTLGETRTHYLALRRRTLYPGELRGHIYEMERKGRTSSDSWGHPPCPAELRVHSDAIVAQKAFGVKKGCHHFLLLHRLNPNTWREGAYGRAGCG